MHLKQIFLLIGVSCLTLLTVAANKQHHVEEEASNPLIDAMSLLVQEALKSGQSGSSDDGAAVVGGSGWVGEMLGSFIQDKLSGGSGGSGAFQILSGLGTLLSNAGSNAGGRGSSGFDPSLLGHLIDLFSPPTPPSASTSDGRNDGQRKPSANSRSMSNSISDQHPREPELGFDVSSLLDLASTFISQQQTDKLVHNGHKTTSSQHRRSASSSPENDEAGSTLMSLLPLAIQAIQSFTGPEGRQTREAHQSHAWALPPFLEQIHVLWDHFVQSDLAALIYEKSGIHQILKNFKSADGKLDYDKLFESLNNQSFRRRWIKSATLYLADWASYFANPDVHLKYYQGAQLIFNGFLQTQGYPEKTLFDPQNPGDSISSLLDHMAQQHLNVDIDSSPYVKLFVNYTNGLLQLGQARGLLQFNAAEISDKLTHTLNLDVIEPILKVHRAFRFISKEPHCDKYVLCKLNQPGTQTTMAKSAGETSDAQGFITSISPRITKIGSMGVAFFISTETGTPFWNLLAAITTEADCETQYPVDCQGFHQGEAKVTTEYVHSEL